ncbi:MAG: HDIG domain-containing protein [Desulfobacula sp.]|nr:HDIG domain-containing protein [Desulfobacula sp.]
MKKSKNDNQLNKYKTFFLTSPQVLWLILAIITLGFSIAHYPGHEIRTYAFKLGDVAKRDIKAPKNFLIEDHAASLQKKAEAREAIKAVYDYDTELLQRIFTNIDSAMKIPGELFDKTNQSDPDPTLAMILETLPPFEEKLGIEVSRDDYLILYKFKFSSDISEKIKNILEKILSVGVVVNKELLLKEEHKGISLRTIGTGEERTVNILKAFYSPEQAKLMVRIEGQPVLKANSHELTNLIVDFCQKLLQPNLFLNKNETARRGKEAEEQIKPILYQIIAGEMIIREGERIGNIHLIKLNALKEQVEKKNLFLSGTGLALISCCILMMGYLLFLKNHKKLRISHNKHISFLALGLVLYLIFAQIVQYIAISSHNELSWETASLSFFMILPIPAAAMITCLFLGFDIAIFFTLILASFTTLSFSGNFLVFIYFFLSGTAAAYWIKERQERKYFIIAGFKLSLFNILLASSLYLYSSRQPELIIFAGEMVMAFCGGLFSAVLTIGFIPLIELIFDYTTDSRLMEFSNLEQPLMKKLMIEAPGTYNHSVIVATLSEAAASAIDAGTLKAKLMGYYHDIGKLSKTLYFIENQADGKNKHDKLSPSMSALILIQHVKKGLEMARQYKLGDEVIEGIAQHHGTSLIKYFYNKSLNSGNGTVKEEDFRYPGPKPQTREAGIVMLADVVEAAIRALERPTSARIQGRVKELINEIFADGQLEECELTLKDLHQIAKSFNNILTSIYHSRIEYPDKSPDRKSDRKSDRRSDRRSDRKSEKQKEKNGTKNGTGKDTDQQSAKKENINGHTPSKSKTDLKRLGL